MRFWLLRAGEVDGVVDFVSHSLWLGEEYFLEWLHSDQSKKAHSSGSGANVKEMLLGPPQFKGYKVVVDQNPGDRVDARSMNLDLRVEKEFARESESQREIIERSRELGLPPISIGAFEGRLLEILLRSAGASKGVEIGTLGGYSTSWLCRAVGTQGKVFSFELDPEKAQIARNNLERAGFSSPQVEIIEGPALNNLGSIEKDGPFDFVFIDADKGNYSRYCQWAVNNLRVGGLILCDNAYIWGGMNFWKLKNKDNVPDCVRKGLHAYTKSQFEAMSECWSQLAEHPSLASLILPTGDGLAIAVKIENG